MDQEQYYLRGAGSDEVDPGQPLRIEQITEKIADAARRELVPRGAWWTLHLVPGGQATHRLALDQGQVLVTDLRTMAT